MTNEEILKKAIKKAKKSGYKVVGEIDDKALSELYGGEYEDQGETFIGFVERAIIFDHEFAKAFFGKELYRKSYNVKQWQIELQKMVLEENPVQYLAKFL